MAAPLESSIRVSEELRKRLASMKSIPEEPYERVILRLIEEHESKGVADSPPAALASVVGGSK